MLSNALASVDGGEPFPVLFEREGVQPFGEAVDALGFTASFERRHALGIARGSVMLIDGVSYTVDGPVAADASGWVTVTLFATAPAPAPAPAPEPPPEEEA